MFDTDFDETIPISVGHTVAVAIHRIVDVGEAEDFEGPQVFGDQYFAWARSDSEMEWARTQPAPTTFDRAQSLWLEEQYTLLDAIAQGRAA